MCEGVQRAAIAFNDVLSLRHFLFEGRIARGEPVAAIRRLDQEQGLPVFRVQAVDHLLGQNDDPRVRLTGSKQSAALAGWTVRPGVDRWRRDGFVTSQKPLAEHPASEFARWRMSTGSGGIA